MESCCSVSSKFITIVLIFLHGLLEAQRAGLGDGAQILFHFFLGHTDTVVGNRQNPVLGIPGDGDGELVPVDAHFVIGEGGVGQLVDGVGGVGDDLPQENLPVGLMSRFVWTTIRREGISVSSSADGANASSNV